MLEIIVTNEYQFPRPANTIYQPDIAEPIAVRFWLNNQTHLIEVIGIQFISSTFVCNSISEKLIEEWQGMHLSQFQFHQFNRDVLFFSLNAEDKFKYQCIDAACHLAKEYSIRLNNYRPIYYFFNEENGVITACIKKPAEVTDAVSNNEIIVNDEYSEIGELKICETNDGLRWLDYLDVDSDCQDEVSKVTMIKLAVRYLNLNAIACVKNAEQYRFYLTDEEEDIIVDCLMKDIITCDMCYFSTRSDYQSSPFILFAGTVDPGRDSEILMQLNPTLQRMGNDIDLLSPIGSPVQNVMF